jgi:hypothetical protein
MRTRSPVDANEVMSAAGDDQAIYAFGWTLSGLATLAAIALVWLFGI